MSETDQSRAKVYPTLGQSWGLLGFIILATIVFSLAVVAVYFVFVLTGRQEGATQLTGSPVSKLIMYSVPFLVVVWLGLKKKKKEEPGYKLNFRVPRLFSLVLIALSTWCIYFLVDPIVDLIPMPPFFEKMILDLLSDHSLPMIIMLVVAAPVFEELLFRGIILDGLLKNYSPQKAIIWSAVLFGIVHLNPWQFLAALAIGVFMGWVYYRTGSLLATMFIHFIANGVGVVLGWLLVPEPGTMMTTRHMVGSNALYFGLLAADILLLLVFIAALKKQFAKAAQA